MSNSVAAICTMNSFETRGIYDVLPKAGLSAGLVVGNGAVAGHLACRECARDLQSQPPHPNFAPLISAKATRHRFGKHCEMRQQKRFDLT